MQPVPAGTRRLAPGCAPGDDASLESTYLDVIERMMASRETRVAWLLGFLTGSALLDMDDVVAEPGDAG